ncbi:MAG: hypothetical protein E7Z88_05060 [Cyanobacteria bacterium SIG27]|nr:hypothetical protein [Cyanobacteria bacterium SIG27]MBQ9150411.1 hypothetical protein [bacterium]
MAVEYILIFYVFVGLVSLVAAFKSIDWLISIKYRTKDECEMCRNVIFEAINKDRDLLVRLDAKMDLVLKKIKDNND